MISLSAKVSLCILLCISLYANAKLTIRNPEGLRSKYNDINGIDYAVLTPQNKITYKRNFIGNVILADPNDACTDLKPIETIGDNAIYNPILVVTWGTCHYAQKVQNAEVAGAKMVILILKHEMSPNHPLTRQLPLNTNIEVLAISAGDGQILLDHLNQNKDNEAVELTYSYDQEKDVNYKNKKVNIEFWFSAPDVSKTSYDFLVDLKEVLTNFVGHFEFTPRYVVWQAHESEATGFSSYHERCISGGRYCDPEHHPKDMLTGSRGVVEDLRQICLREGESSKELSDLNSYWWKYVIDFGNRCAGKTLNEIHLCREEVYNHEEIPGKVVGDVGDCMKNSFGGVEEADFETTNQDNTMLKKEYEDRLREGIDHYPVLLVNKQRYTGSYRNKFTLQEHICSHFIQDQLPQVCKPTVPTVEHVYSSHDTGVYVLIIIGSVLAMAVMLYCVRRTVKRQVMGRMNDEIYHIVTQYKQFKDKSNTFNADDDV